MQKNKHKIIQMKVLLFVKRQINIEIYLLI